MKKLVAVLVFFSATVFSQPASKVLALEELIQLAKKNDPQFQQIIIEKLPVKFRKDLELPSSQWLISLGNEYGLSTQGDGTTSVLVTTLNKDFRQTGTSVSLSHRANDQTDREEDTTEIRIEQSILKNAFGSQVRQLAKTIETENKVILLQVAESYEDYVALLIANYLDWRLAFLNHQTARLLYKDAIKLQENVEARRRRHIALDVDVHRAKLQTLTQLENLLEIEKSLHSAKALIAQATGQPELQQLPASPETFEKRELFFAVDIDRFFSASRSSEIYQLTEEALKARWDLQKEELMADIQLVAGFNIDRSVRFSTAVNREEALVGVNVELPLGASLQQAEVQQSSYLYRKAVLERQSFLQARRAELEALRTKIAKQRQQTEVSKGRWLTAQKIFAQEQLRYQRGQIPLESLIDTENLLANSQFSYHANLTQLSKDVVEWLRQTDQLVVKEEEIAL